MTVAVEKHYSGEVGTAIVVDCGRDVSEATICKILVKKPSGDEVEWDATVYQSNYLRYVVEEDDLDEVGEYEVQSYVEIDDWSGKGVTDRFIIYEKYS